MAMKPNFRVIALALILIATRAVAEEYKLGSLEIIDPWSRATPKGAKVAAGYVKIHNAGAVADRLIAASSEAAARVEIHEMATDHGVMRMRPVGGGVEIRPGETVELQPSGFHL